MILNSTIEEQLKQVFNLEYLLECYELRLSLCKENYAEKSEFEKNEMYLLIFKTKHHISKTKCLIRECKIELNDNLKLYFQELKELKQEQNGDGSMFDYQ
jgi:hypothetical protein